MSTPLRRVYAGLIEPHNIQWSDYALLQHTACCVGTFGGLAFAVLYTTEQNRLERTAPNPLRINMLAMAAQEQRQASAQAGAGRQAIEVTAWLSRQQ
jgi:hypothetical protein